MAINPKGAVPAIKLDDGQVLTEGGRDPAVHRRQGARQRSSRPPPARWSAIACRRWLNYIASEVHKGIGQLFNKAMPDDFKETVKKGLAAKQFPFLEKALAGRDYLMGDFTVADGYLFTVLNWTKFHNIDLSAFPNITAFMKRVAARPAVQEAMKAEGLLKAAA